MGAPTVKLSDIEFTITAKLEAAQEQITEYLRPIIQREFDLVRRQRPTLKRLIFGNGTFAFEFEGDDPDWWRKEEMPAYAHRLWDLAEIAGSYGTWIEGYIDGDITPKGAEAP
jgi:hypothetical protein